MDYPKSLEFLYRLARGRGLKLGLSRVRRGALMLGSPHLVFPSVHVAGTNGKGSVSAMAASVLKEAGYRVGLFTSPHLHRLTERIRINGQEISRKDLSRLASDMALLLDRPGAPQLTFFEVITLSAFRYFAEHSVDIAVVEVGLGGRLDATNIVEPKVSVITGIGLDHTDLLGNDLLSISREKAGIMKRQVPVVLGLFPKEVKRYLRQRAARLQCPQLWLDKDFGAKNRDLSEKDLDYFGPHGDVNGISLSLKGEYQRRNASMAIAALQELGENGFHIHQGHIRKGLGRASWPGRMEFLGHAPAIILDAAHNSQGAEILAHELDALAPRRTALLFGVLKDKNVSVMLQHLRKHATKVFLAMPPVGRGRDPRTYAAAGDVVCNDVEQALGQAGTYAGRKGRVIVAGSIYLVAAARSLLKPDEPCDPLIDL